MPRDIPADLIESLADAWRHGRRTPAAPWTARLPDAEAAYAAQAALGSAMGWFAGAPPRHWKSGGGSRSAVLTHAPLPPHGVRTSPASFTDLILHSRGIEAEIALRLAHDVTPAQAAALDEATAASLIDAMAVSIEVVDSRWAEASAAAPLLRLVDLQSHGALALGEWVPYEPRDWSAQRCEVRIGTRDAASFTGSHSLGDPAWLLPTWLRHLTREGASVSAGSVVTTGTWCGLLQADAGDEVSVRFDGIGEARLTL